MGLIPQRKSLAAVEKLAASAFCRRRLPVVMVRLKMAETLKEAITFIEQGLYKIFFFFFSKRENNNKYLFFPK